MDMSSKPEGATHYVEGSRSPWEKRIGDDWFTFNDENGEWWCCSRGTGDERLVNNPMAPVLIDSGPTLETMLTEWRDLEARAQVAQAEADALFEHAGQCHGEIVVRLAELGWGAPRMVPGAPVVTLDDNDGWIEWKGGKCPVRPGTVIDVKDRDGEIHEGVEALEHYSNYDYHWSYGARCSHDCEIIAYRITPSTQL